MHDVGAPVASPSGLHGALGSWSTLMERLPIGVYVCDAEGLVVSYNPRAAELWGRNPPKAAVRFCGALKTFEVDGAELPPDRSPMALVLASGQAVRDRELIVERPDGERRHVVANAEPLFDDDGRLAGAVNCVQDVTELRRTHAQLQERRNWTRAVIESSPVATYFTDADGVILGFNQAAARLWGREPRIGLDRWCGSHKLFRPDGQPLPLSECTMAETIRSGRQVLGEAVFERPDGSRGAFLAYPTPLKGADGALAGAINMLVDISERKAAEDLQRALLDELNHRVKNTLATVQSLALHSFRDERSPADMRGAFEARLMALSHAHNRLAARNWENADLKVIVGDILEPFIGGPDRVTAEGPSLRLSAREAVTLAMILHELAANALKFGALSVPDGHLSVLWRREAGLLRLDWTEAGGPQVLAPSSRGFGSRFIEGAVARELAGEVAFDFAPQGLSCRIGARLAA